MVSSSSLVKLPRLRPGFRQFTHLKRQLFPHLINPFSFKLKHTLLIMNTKNYMLNLSKSSKRENEHKKSSNLVNSTIHNIHCIASKAYLSLIMIYLAFSNIQQFNKKRINEDYIRGFFYSSIQNFILSSRRICIMPIQLLILRK